MTIEKYDQIYLSVKIKGKTSIAKTRVLTMQTFFCEFDPLPNNNKTLEILPKRARMVFLLQIGLKMDHMGLQLD